MKPNSRGIIAWDVPGEAQPLLTLSGSVSTTMVQTFGADTVTTTRNGTFSGSQSLTPALFPWTQAGPGFEVNSDTEVYTMQWPNPSGQIKPGGFIPDPVAFNSMSFDASSGTFTPGGPPQVDRVVAMRGGITLPKVTLTRTITHTSPASSETVTEEYYLQLDAEATDTTIAIDPPPGSGNFWRLSLLGWVDALFGGVFYCYPGRFDAAGDDDFPLTFDLPVAAGTPRPTGTKTWSFGLGEAPPDYTAYDISYTATLA